MGVFTIVMLAANILLIIAVAVLIVKRPRVITLTDKRSSRGRIQYDILQLQNEIRPYIYYDGQNVCLKVVRK